DVCSSDLVGEAADVGGAVGALVVAHGNLNDAEVELGRAEDEIEVPEGTEVAEVGSPRGQMRLVRAPDDLGPAQGVLDVLAYEHAQEQAEEPVAEEVEKPRRSCPSGEPLDVDLEVFETIWAGDQTRDHARVDGPYRLEDLE